MMRCIRGAGMMFATGIWVLAGMTQGCSPADEPAPVAEPDAPIATAIPQQATPTPPQPATSPRPAAAPTTPPPTRVARTQSPVAPAGRKAAKKLPEFSSNLLNNGSFEYVADDGRPGGWAVQPPSIAKVVEGSAHHGKKALELTSTADSFGILAYNLRLEPSDLGKSIVVSALAQSGSHWGLTMQLEAKMQGEAVTLARTGWTEAPGAWTRAELKTELPADIDPESVRVKFVTKKEDGQAFKLDDVRAFIDLVSNGSFEIAGEDGRPGGWVVSPVESIRQGESVTPHDGENALAIESTDDKWIVVARKLDVSDSDLGRKLTVAAHGRTPVARGMFLSVQCTAGDETRELGNTPWQASPDKWTQVQTTIELPNDADPASVQARIKIRNKGDQRYFIDDVQAKLH